MTTPNRLTPEREKEIREQANEPYYLDYVCFTGNDGNELLSEIDALRAEFKDFQEFGQTTASDKLIVSLSRQIVVIGKERDALKAENKELVYKLESLLCYATGGLYSYSSYTLDAMKQQVDEHIEREIENALAKDEKDETK